MNKKWLMPKEEYEKCVDEFLTSTGNVHLWEYVVLAQAEHMVGKIRKIRDDLKAEGIVSRFADDLIEAIEGEHQEQEQDKCEDCSTKLCAKSPEGQPVEKCEQECIENYHKATQGGEAEAELLTEIAKLCRQQDVMTMQDCGGTLFEQWGEMAEESRVFYYSSADQILAHCESLIRVSVYKEIEAYRVPKEVYPFTEPIIISKEQFASLKSGKGVK